MHPNPEAAPSTNAVDARTLLVAKLATLAIAKSRTENVPLEKRGTFLTRRFFSGKDKKDAAQTAENPLTAAEPQNPKTKRPGRSKGQPMTTETESPREPSLTLAGSFFERSAFTLPATPEGTIPTDGPSLNSMASEQAQPPADNIATGAIKHIPTPEMYAPPPSDRPTSAATDFSGPRITVSSTHRPPTIMSTTQTTNHPSAVGQASAQLTLGFEITSLQLTPFFRMGSVQLKALSNVVSLSLVAAQQVDNPLAAGISFHIERVELDGASHFKNILLKPLGEARAVATPQSGLQVDGVAIAGVNEDNPISVTTSGTTSTPVQLIGMFAVSAMEFTPAFEINSLRLEPVSNTLLLRVAPSSSPNTQALPSSFDIAEVQLGDGAQVHGVRLVPRKTGTA